MYKDHHEIGECSNTGCQVGIGEEDADQEAVTEHGHGVDGEVEEEKETIDGRQNTTQLQDECDAYH